MSRKCFLRLKKTIIYLLCFTIFVTSLSRSVIVFADDNKLTGPNGEQIYMVSDGDKEATIADSYRTDAGQFLLTDGTSQILYSWINRECYCVYDGEVESYENYGKIMITVTETVDGKDIEFAIFPNSDTRFDFSKAKAYTEADAEKYFDDIKDSVFELIENQDDGNWIIGIALTLFSWILDFIICGILEFIVEAIVGGDLTNIILQDVQDKGVVGSLYTFSFEKGNIYGIIAAVVYSIIKVAALCGIVIYLMWAVIMAAARRGTVQGHNIFKEDMASVAIRTFFLFAAPAIIIILFDIRADFMLDFKNALFGEGNNFTDVIRSLKNAKVGGIYNFVLVLIRIAYLGLTVYFAYQYILLSMCMTMLIISLGVSIMISGRNFKDNFANWFGHFKSIFLTPLIDMATLGIPLIMGASIKASNKVNVQTIRQVFVLILAMFCMLEVRKLVRKYLKLEDPGVDMLGSSVSGLTKDLMQRANMRDAFGGKGKGGRGDVANSGEDDERKAEQYADLAKEEERFNKEKSDYQKGIDKEASRLAGGKGDDEPRGFGALEDKKSGDGKEDNKDGKSASSENKSNEEKKDGKASLEGGNKKSLPGATDGKADGKDKVEKKEPNTDNAILKDAGTEVKEGDKKAKETAEENGENEVKENQSNVSAVNNEASEALDGQIADIERNNQDAKAVLYGQEKERDDYQKQIDDLDAGYAESQDVIDNYDAERQKIEDAADTELKEAEENYNSEMQYAESREDEEQIKADYEGAVEDIKQRKEGELSELQDNFDRAKQNVSKYEADRADAKRKLDSVNKDIEKTKDGIAKGEKQVAELKQQKDKLTKGADNGSGKSTSSDKNGNVKTGDSVLGATSKDDKGSSVSNGGTGNGAEGMGDAASKSATTGGTSGANAETGAAPKTSEEAIQALDKGIADRKEIIGSLENAVNGSREREQMLQAQRKGTAERFDRELDNLEVEKAKAVYEGNKDAANKATLDIAEKKQEKNRALATYDQSIDNERASREATQARIGGLKSQIGQMEENRDNIIAMQSVANSMENSGRGGKGGASVDPVTAEHNDRVRDVMRSYATLSNFDSEEYAQHFSNAEMAEMYQQRAEQTRRNAKVAKAFGIAGGVIGGAFTMGYGAQASYRVGRAVGNAVAGKVLGHSNKVMRNEGIGEREERIQNAIDQSGNAGVNVAYGSRTPNSREQVYGYNPGEIPAPTSGNVSGVEAQEMGGAAPINTASDSVANARMNATGDIDGSLMNDEGRVAVNNEGGGTAPAGRRSVRQAISESGVADYARQVAANQTLRNAGISGRVVSYGAMDNGVMQPENVGRLGNVKNGRPVVRTYRQRETGATTGRAPYIPRGKGVFTPIGTVQGGYDFSSAAGRDTRSSEETSVYQNAVNDLKSMNNPVASSVGMELGGGLAKIEALINERRGTSGNDNGIISDGVGGYIWTGRGNFEGALSGLPDNASAHIRDCVTAVQDMARVELGPEYAQSPEFEKVLREFYNVSVVNNSKSIKDAVSEEMFIQAARAEALGSK